MAEGFADQAPHRSDRLKANQSVSCREQTFMKDTDLIADQVQLTRYPWLWDTDMDNGVFEDILCGRKDTPPYDFRWALLRLVEYAPYAEIKRLLPRDRFLAAWPDLAPRVRSQTRRRGMDFWQQWLRQQEAVHA